MLWDGALPGGSEQHITQPYLRSSYAEVCALQANLRRLGPSPELGGLSGCLPRAKPERLIRRMTECFHALLEKLIALRRGCDNHLAAGCCGLPMPRSAGVTKRGNM